MSTRSRVSRALRAAPWLLILCLIALVQVIRGMPFDAVVFAAAGVVLAVDLIRRPAATRARPALDGNAVLAVGVGLAALLVLLPRHGAALGIVLGAAGLATVAWAWLAPPVRAAESRSVVDRRVRRRRAALGWAIVLVTACLIELVSFLLGRVTATAKLDHPALSELLDPVLDTPIGRTVFVLVWLGIGALLLTRGRRTDA